ncbi:MAG: TauD/TfdA family dioxygenase [Elusimicrobia bacterium]|nr:TauD/TfdA family dioxygenase [Elusimicrobiota bacterium]
MTIKARPLAGSSFGAEILGMDFADRREFPEVERLLVEAGILLFSGAKIGVSRHLKLMRHFGPLIRLPHKPSGSGTHPAVMVRSSWKNRDCGGLVFHFDQAYRPLPCAVSSLYCLAAPKIGGATFFADTHAAYEALPDELKNKLEGKRALNCCNTPGCRSGERHRSAHPVFRAHPVTRRRAVYVSRAMTAGIVGLPRAESDRTLQALFSYQELRRSVYIHPWAEGDLILIDNRRMIHGRDGVDPRQRRAIRMVMSAPERPF